MFLGFTKSLDFTNHLYKYGSLSQHMFFNSDLSLAFLNSEDSGMTELIREEPLKNAAVHEYCIDSEMQV